MEKPLVSIIVPTYNRAHLVPRAIESVLAQTYDKIELIVVDDGSKDNTRDVLATYGDRLTVITQENGGAGSARNTGIEAAHGEFMMFLDSDDVLFPTKVEKQVNYLLAHPDVAIVLCGFRRLDNNGNRIADVYLDPTRVSVLESILESGLSGLFPPLVAMIQRDKIPADLRFDETLPAREEQDFWLQCAVAQCRFAAQKEILCEFYATPDSRGQNIDRGIAGEVALLDKLFADKRLPARIQKSRDIVYARVYLDAAIRYLSKCTSLTGEHARLVGLYAQKAFSLDPSLSTWEDSSMDAVIYQSISLSPSQPFESLQQIEQLMFDSKEHRNLERKLTGRIYKVLAYDAFAKKDKRGLWQNGAHALLANPMLIFDWGLLSLLMHSFLQML